MHLKRLELAGFKSFADRTYLDFGKGLNAVVGPNGSGKSNIADALRWVLGEQSAKQLRGGKMEDIIFNGTAHRKPLGFAEITMRLDNSTQTLPLELKDITVTRRVYRSGESEFAINGTPCRLKDIQTLFMDTGIGRDGYSIVGQGRIDEILSLKSEDRRQVFEEAAGIVKYKSRRNEALHKLDKERQNRARVDDIITELEEQLEPLKEQSEQAKLYLSLRDQYKDVHLNIFLNEIGKIEIELKQVNEFLKNGLTEAEDGKRRLTEARAAGEKLKAKATETDLKYRQANENLLETTTSIEKKESDIKLLQNQMEQLDVDQIRITGESEKRTQLLAEKREEQLKEEAIKAQAQKELDGFNHELNQQLQRAHQRDEAMKESSSALNAHNKNVMDAMTAVAEAQSHVLEAENTYKRLEDDKERLNIEIQHHDLRIEEQTTVCTQAESTLQTNDSELTRAQRSYAAYVDAHNQLIEESRQLGHELRQTQETLTATRGRYRALNALEAQQEGYYRSVKAVLRKKITDPNFSGICGAVSELIGVQADYEIAIETALGGSAQNIITNTEADAKLAIEMLKQTKEGRATFLPLSAVKGRLIDAAKFSGERGFIGIASALISCDDVYIPVINQLLGDVIVADNIDNALAMHKKFKYSQKIVTLSGERLSPGGAITGGATARQSSGIIGRSRNLVELKQQVETLEANLKILTQQEHELSQKRQATEETLEGARAKVQSLKLDQQLQQDKLNTAKEALVALQQRAAQYNEENDELMTQLVESNHAIRVAKQELKTQESLSAQARAELEHYQQQLEANRQEHSEEADTLTDLRVEISRRNEWISRGETNIQRIRRECEIITQEQRQLEKELATSKEAFIKAAADKEIIKDELARLKTRLEEIRSELTAAETEKSTLEAAISHAETDERTHTDTTALLDKELTRLEMRKEHLDATSHRLHNEIWEEYSLTHQQAAVYKRSDISEAALRRESHELKSQLAQLTNVNIGSIEAYKQLTTRHDFLTSQRDDILTAEESLNELIQSLTSQMESQFAEQFAQIAIHFGDVFKEMFGGGTASLRLVDTENVLESGIEITVQPPGKALQNLMLLSGGERALTAIALLFAILRLKPSPFCVLDEIESALDDANVTRFANFMQEYSKGTQFIVITHRKGTMEAADRLYGVTMEEQGISKLVSVSFIEN